MNIFVTAKTGAKETRIEQVDDTHFIIFVSAEPVRGKANEAIRNVLATYLHIPKTRLSLIRGASSRQKVFAVI